MFPLDQGLTMTSMTLKWSWCDSATFPMEIRRIVCHVKACRIFHVVGVMTMVHASAGMLHVVSRLLSFRMQLRGQSSKCELVPSRVVAA
jgi:hypothetical protein